MDRREPEKSREEKLREAKRFFQSSGIPVSEGRNVSPSKYQKSSMGRMWETEPEEDDFFDGGQEQRKPPYSLYRLISAALLLGLLITAFQFRFSYGGFHRDAVEKILSDDSHYQELVRQAELVMKQWESR